MFKVISHGVLVNCGWNSVFCLCCFGLCFIYYTSQSFIVAWFSVCLSLMSVYPLVNKLQNQNPKNLFYLVLFCEIVLACYLVIWEQFMSLTSFAPFPSMKLKHTFPGLSIIQLLFRGGQNQQIIKTTFHQIDQSGY